MLREQVVMKWECFGQNRLLLNDKLCTLNVWSEPESEVHNLLCPPRGLILMSHQV